MIKIKKAILFIILSTISISSIFSEIPEATLSFLPPMGQNNNVNMAAHGSYPVYEGKTSLGFLGDLDDGSQAKPTSTAYSNSNLIGVIGIDNIPNDQFGDGSSLTLTIDANYSYTTGAYVFKSENNPMYQRPFKISVVAKQAAKNNISNGAFWDLQFRDNTKTQELTNSVQHLKGETPSTTWSNIASSFRADGLSRDTTGVFIDIILSLPKPDDATDDSYTSYSDNRIEVDGFSYYLAEANDYNTVINFTLTFTGVNRDSTTKSFSIPVSGFFSLTGAGKNEDYCAVSISKLPQASNLNIKNDSGRWVDIATINLLKNVGRTNTTWWDSRTPQIPTECTTDKVCFFVSSNKNPYVDTGTFKLVRTNVGPDDPLDERNSIGYKIRLKDTQDHTWVFDGSAKMDTSSPESIFDKAQLEGGVNVNDPVNVKGYFMPYVNNYYHYNHFHQFLGDMQIMIDPYSTMMYAGAYTSTVYIHIISEEEPT